MKNKTSNDGKRVDTIVWGQPIVLFDGQRLLILNPTGTAFLMPVATGLHFGYGKESLLYQELVEWEATNLPTLKRNDNVHSWAWKQYYLQAMVDPSSIAQIAEGLVWRKNLSVTLDVKDIIVAFPEFVLAN